MKTKVKKIIIIILALIVLGCAIYIIRYFVMQKHSKNLYDNLQSEVKKETQLPHSESESESEKEPVVIPIDFTSLWDMNEDVYAWINVEGTKIDYPVLRKKDASDQFDDYYLDHTIDNLSGLPGSIYVEPINAADVSDDLTVMYGHNMKDGTMFGCLHMFDSEEFFKEHDTITVYTPEHILTYKIYAAVEFPDTHLMRGYGPNGANEEFLNALNSSYGYFRENMSPTKEDQFLVLSTCIGNKADRRWFVVGVLETLE